MRILPELETYRDHLAAKASAWAETPEPELLRDLSQSRQQTELLEKAVAEMRRRLADGAGADEEKLKSRLAIQDQMRELTAAYAEALRIILDRRQSASPPAE